MPSDHSVTRWLEEFKQGDEAAAQKLWERYFDRLVRVARKRLQDAPRRAADEEDIALSAFHSLFRGLEAGKFPQLTARDDLWALLIVIVVRKANRQLQHERREKRGGGQVRGESALLDADGLAGIEQFLGDEPTPEFAVQIAEETERFLQALPDVTFRQIAVWKLENYNQKEIAEKLNLSEETIRRKLIIIKEILNQSAESP